jgi:antitoxin (DNA-binding transcriptional repressor) of toxin-antitoxin stability system
VSAHPLPDCRPDARRLRRASAVVIDAAAGAEIVADTRRVRPVAQLVPAGAEGWIPVSAVAGVEVLSGLGQHGEFRFGDFGVDDRVICEGGESAVGVEQDPFYAEKVYSALGAAQLKGGKSRSGSCTPWRALP